MLQACIQQLIDAVCPNTGMSFGKLNDNSTWKIFPTKDASEEQIKAAEKIMAEFVWDKAKEDEYNKRKRNAEKSNDALHKYCFEMYKEKNSGASFSEFLDYLESIKIS